MIDIAHLSLLSLTVKQLVLLSKVASFTIWEGIYGIVKQVVLLFKTISFLL